MTRVMLPAGPTVRYDRTDLVGEPVPWRRVVFAIETPRGIAWLEVTGPADSWASRLGDVHLMAISFRVR